MIAIFEYETHTVSIEALHPLSLPRLACLSQQMKGSRTHSITPISTLFLCRSRFEVWSETCLLDGCEASGRSVLYRPTLHSHVFNLDVRLTS